MSEYKIIKREKCGHCAGTRINPAALDDEGWQAIKDGKALVPFKSDLSESIYCPICVNGYIETQVDADEWLLSRLNAARWSSAVKVGTKWKWSGLRFEDAE